MTSLKDAITEEAIEVQLRVDPLATGSATLWPTHILV